MDFIESAEQIGCLSIKYEGDAVMGAVVASMEPATCHARIE